MRKPTLIATALAATVALAASAPASAKTPRYSGKTKEGTKISFVVQDGWLDRLDTLLPTTCVSAQGGTPIVDFTEWRIPFKYRIGGTAKVEYGDPTKHYEITTTRHGTQVRGKLSINYSLLGSTSGGSYVIYTCLATASFKLRPHR